MTTPSFHFLLPFQYTHTNGVDRFLPAP